MSEGETRACRESVRPDAVVEFQHVLCESPGGAEEKSAQETREEGTISLPEGGDEIVEVDSGEEVEVGGHDKFPLP